METVLNPSKHHQNVTMIGRLDWPITVVYHWPQDLGGILTAKSKQKSTILIISNGMMPLNIRMPRTCFISIVSAFLIVFLTVYLRKISLYSVASTSAAAFVIGGNDGSSYFDVIAKYDHGQWSRYGNLQKSRSNHGSITSGTDTLVIGGYTDDGS